MMPKSVDSLGEKGPMQRPPNYLSRRVQLRLLMLVGLLMLTLTMMFEAAKPSRWYWLWGGHPPVATAPSQATGMNDRHVDTVLRDVGSPVLAAGDVRLLVDGSLNLSELPQDGFYAQLSGQAWRRHLRSLEPRQRNLLYLILRRVSSKRPLRQDQRDMWPTIIDQLNRSWDSFFEKLAQTIGESKFDDSNQAAQWQYAARQLKQDWATRQLPALQTLGGNIELTSESRETLAQLAKLLDQIAWDSVRDNTVFRSAEHHAWFGCIDQLSTSDARSDDANEQTGFYQLYSQPDEYRGKLISIDGTARVGYQLTAPSNEYGVEKYYVLWIKPTGTRDAVVTVYCLRLPEGFPEIADRDATGLTTDLKESVQLTGIFFKRWAYQAQDATRTTPLLIANTITWQPAPVDSQRTLGRPPTTLAIAACGVLAIACAWLVCRWNRPSPLEQRYSVKSQTDPDQLKKFDADLGESHVRDTLARLAQSDGDNAGDESSS